MPTVRDVVCVIYALDNHFTASAVMCIYPFENQRVMWYQNRLWWFPWLSSGACHFDFGDFTEKWATVRDMNRYLKYVLCQYPYICGQVYISSRGLAIQTMWNNDYAIFLDCRAMKLKLNRGGCGTRIYRYNTGQYTPLLQSGTCTKHI